jgi:hypothetical protein
MYDLFDQAFLARVAARQVWSAREDMSAAVATPPYVNPYKTWTFARKASINNTTVALLSASIDGWLGPESFSLPLISANGTMHPGATSNTVSVRWTCPINATVVVEAKLTKQDTGATNGVRTAIYKNSTTLIYGITTLQIGDSATYSGQQVSMTVNDTLDLVVENNGTVNSDHTTLDYFIVRSV